MILALILALTTHLSPLAILAIVFSCGFLIDYVVLVILGLVD